MLNLFLFIYFISETVVHYGITSLISVQSGVLDDSYCSNNKVVQSVFTTLTFLRACFQTEKKVKLYNSFQIHLTCYLTDWFDVPQYWDVLIPRRHVGNLLKISSNQIIGPFRVRTTFPAQISLIQCFLVIA